MKKLILFGFLMFGLWSCSPDDDNLPSFYLETLPIESVNIPEVFVFGSTYEISMTYLRPTGCHLFNDFYYVSELNQRTIAIINTVFTDQPCTDLEDEFITVSFDFQVTSMDNYVFRFWLGPDESGNDTYHIVEIPVIN
ncbi:hypothetical protein [uncultured Psychroserpens sp.]|uniref:hypothetical protein n=1 Tax=uncultured Psychroserpens sp. TaxID=255436 RepID=UPI00263A2C47|nr:hypothetical protein [uncultured Psychroserpens sp.]